jgi:hypothetical protein
MLDTHQKNFVVDITADKKREDAKHFSYRGRITKLKGDISGCGLLIKLDLE